MQQNTKITQVRRRKSSSSASLGKEPTVLLDSAAARLVKSDEAKYSTEKDYFKSKSIHSVLQRFALWFHFTSFVLGTRKSCWFTVINDCMPFTCKMTHNLEAAATTALKGGDQDLYANLEIGRSSDGRQEGSRPRDDSKDEVNFNFNRGLFQFLVDGVD